MATTQAQQPSVIELIEQQDFAKAIKLCNTKIHKGVNSNYFKTLKGYCLMKTK